MTKSAVKNRLQRLGFDLTEKEVGVLVDDLDRERQEQVVDEEIAELQKGLVAKVARMSAWAERHDDNAAILREIFASLQEKYKEGITEEGIIEEGIVAMLAGDAFTKEIDEESLSRISDFERMRIITNHCLISEIENQIIQKENATKLAEANHRRRLVIQSDGDDDGLVIRNETVFSDDDVSELAVTYSRREGLRKTLESVTRVEGDQLTARISDDQALLGRGDVQRREVLQKDLTVHQALQAAIQADEQFVNSSAKLPQVNVVEARKAELFQRLDVIRGEIKDAKTLMSDDLDRHGGFEAEIKDFFEVIEGLEDCGIVEKMNRYVASKMREEAGEAGEAGEAERIQGELDGILGDLCRQCGDDRERIDSIRTAYRQLQESADAYIQAEVRATAQRREIYQELERLNAAAPVAKRAVGKAARARGAPAASSEAEEDLLFNSSRKVIAELDRIKFLLMSEDKNHQEVISLILEEMAQESKPEEVSALLVRLGEEATTETCITTIDQLRAKKLQDLQRPNATKLVASLQKELQALDKAVLVAANRGITEARQVEVSVVGDAAEILSGIRRGAAEDQDDVDAIDRVTAEIVLRKEERLQELLIGMKGLFDPEYDDDNPASFGPRSIGLRSAMNNFANIVDAAEEGGAVEVEVGEEDVEVDGDEVEAEGRDKKKVLAKAKFEVDGSFLKIPVTKGSAEDFRTLVENYFEIEGCEIDRKTKPERLIVPIKKILFSTKSIDSFLSEATTRRDKAKENATKPLSSSRKEVARLASLAGIIPAAAMVIGLSSRALGLACEAMVNVTERKEYNPYLAVVTGFFGGIISPIASILNGLAKTSFDGAATMLKSSGRGYQGLAKWSSERSKGIEQSESKRLAPTPALGGRQGVRFLHKLLFAPLFGAISIIPYSIAAGISIVADTLHNWGTRLREGTKDLNALVRVVPLLAVAALKFAGSALTICSEACAACGKVLAAPGLNLKSTIIDEETGTTTEVLSNAGRISRFAKGIKDTADMTVAEKLVIVNRKNFSPAFSFGRSADESAGEEDDIYATVRHAVRQIPILHKNANVVLSIKDENNEFKGARSYIQFAKFKHGSEEYRVLQARNGDVLIVDKNNRFVETVEDAVGFNASFRDEVARLLPGERPAGKESKPGRMERQEKVGVTLDSLSALDNAALVAQLETAAAVKKGPCVKSFNKTSGIATYTVTLPDKTIFEVQASVVEEKAPAVTASGKKAAAPKLVCDKKVAEPVSIRTKGGNAHPVLEEGSVKSDSLQLLSFLQNTATKMREAEERIKEVQAQDVKASAERGRGVEKGQRAYASDVSARPSVRSRSRGADERGVALSRVGRAGVAGVGGRGGGGK